MADFIKRNPGVEVVLVPYGGGWTDVYLNIGADKLYFIASNSMGSSFSELVETLYYLSTDNDDYVELDKDFDGFTWDEEGASSTWRFELSPPYDENSMLKLAIDINRNESKHYEYEIKYKDMCYAVAKTLTNVLKSYGIMGYHRSTYTDDINMRHFLYLKAVALDYENIQKYTDLGDGKGVASDFEKELELLLFDM